MSDLISRSEVNDVIDELEVYTSGRPNTMKVEVSVLQLQRFINKLKNIPTAYDVDKVVKELEAEQQKYKAQALETDDIDTVFRCAINEVAMQTAIDIVKRGVDTENNHNKEAYFTALEDYHRLISEECKFMLIKYNPYALHLKEYNDKVLEQLKAGGNY